MVNSAPMSDCWYAILAAMVMIMIFTEGMLIWRSLV